MFSPQKLDSFHLYESCEYKEKHQGLRPCTNRWATTNAEGVMCHVPNEYYKCTCWYSFSAVSASMCHRQCNQSCQPTCSASGTEVTQLYIARVWMMVVITAWSLHEQHSVTKRSQSIVNLIPKFASNTQRNGVNWHLTIDHLRDDAFICLGNNM